MTPCEKIGLKVGDKIRVLQEGRCKPVGTILTLELDDGSYCPRFITEKGLFVYFGIAPAHHPRLLPEGEGWERVFDETITTQLRKAIAKRDKHRAKLDKWSEEVERLIGELEREIEEATGLSCKLGYKRDTAGDSKARHGSAIPEGVDVDDPKTWQNGDVIKCVGERDGFITAGNLYEFGETDGFGGVIVKFDDEGDYDQPCFSKFRFVRRPSEG